MIALSVDAAPPAECIPLGSYGEALTVPVDNPVKFRRFDQINCAEFTGRLVLEATFVLDCETTQLGSSLSPVRRNAIAPLPRAISAADRAALLASPPTLQ